MQRVVNIRKDANTWSCPPIEHDAPHQPDQTRQRRSVWPVCLFACPFLVSLFIDENASLFVGACFGWMRRWCHWNGGRRTTLDTLCDITFASDVLDFGGVA
eukprot:scaffold162_cov206-Alexandrium_tamarense.AAC.1